jgi:hypothetical protein
MTQKQVRAIKLLSENVRKPIGKVMLEAGYSLESSKKPKRLTDSKAFKEIMHEYFPDRVLAKVAQDGLKATKLHGTTDDFVEIPDHQARHKFWRDIVALKGYTPEGGGVANTQINISFGTDGYIPPDNIQGLKPTLERK